MYEIFTQLSIGVSSIIALIIISKEFLKHISKDREQCNEIITNHLTSHAKTNLKLEGSIEKLTEINQRLINWFDRNGNGK